VIDMKLAPAMLGLVAGLGLGWLTTSIGADAPKMTVYKSATCGCCKLWIDHVKKAGYVTEAHDVTNMNGIKEKVGVPAGKGSCHTAQIDGYFIEGHVPAAEIDRLLKERPKAKGLTVPAMPLGSPGMEVPSGQVDRYDVLLVKEDGSTEVFATYPKAAASK
jgi:hypothetical protein